jgi:hypothetical protein
MCIRRKINYLEERFLLTKVNSQDKIRLRRFMEGKTLDGLNIKDVKKKVTDVKVFGNGDLWQLINKASSEKQGWMKSTKVLEIKDEDGDVAGCIVQVSTQQRNPDGSYAVAEAVTYVDSVKIGRDKENLYLTGTY